MMLKKRKKSRRKQLAKRSKDSCARNETCKHEWVVFSTAIGEGWLMVQCVKCGDHGTVNNPTEEEWGRAFHAPSSPYRWEDGSRVTIRHRGNGEFYVKRGKPPETCECVHKLPVADPESFERVWMEFTRPRESLTEEEQQDLESLARSVEEADLCSGILPFFVESLSEHTEYEPTAAVRKMVERIAMAHRKGAHCSPSVVARMLREYGKGKPAKKGDEQ